MQPPKNFNIDRIGKVGGLGFKVEQKIQKS